MPSRPKELYGIAICNYDGSNVHKSLQLTVGDIVIINDECDGWYEGCLSRDRTQQGIFPVNFVHKKCNSRRCRSRICMDHANDCTVIEVANVLREWGRLWKELYLNRDHKEFVTFCQLMNKLFALRRQFITGTLTQDQIKDLRMRITTNIDWGNRSLGLDLVPRVNYDIVDPSKVNILDLYNIHSDSVEKLSAVKRDSKVQSLVLADSSEAAGYHISVKVRDLTYRITDDWELYFSIYNPAKSQFITEKFLVRVYRKGEAQFTDLFHEENFGAIFAGLGNSEAETELYLICQVYRVGRILAGESTRKPSLHTYKRPLGCAVMNLSTLNLPSSPMSTVDGISPGFVDLSVANGLRSPGETRLFEKDFNEKIYTCEEKEFHQLHELIIKKQTQKFYSLSNQVSYAALDVNVKVLRGSLPRVMKEEPLLFTAYPTVLKKGFSDVIMPGDLRNDLYLTLCRGDFEKAGRNVQVQLSVLDGQTAEPIECIHPAVSKKEGLGCSVYQSAVLYHQNSPNWDDCVRLSIPVDKFPSAIVRLEFFHCSTKDKNDKKLFGVAFRKLMDEEGCSIRDGMHTLSVQSCDDLNKISREDQEMYLKESEASSLCSNGESGSLTTQSSTSSLASAAVGVEFLKRGVSSLIGGRSGKDFVHVGTMLCSTKFTQNADLFALLNRNNSRFSAVDVLNRVMSLDGEELVKFLQHILDELFSMFSTESGESTPYSGQVFQALVNIFTTINDSKFHHFRPVLEAYIKDHFSAALVYKGLTTCVNHCAEKLLRGEKHPSIFKGFDALEFIFKFMIQSRILFAQSTQGRNEDSFRADVFLLMDSLKKILASGNPDYVRTQVAIQRNIPSMVEQLARVFPVSEVCVVAVGLLQCVPGSTLPGLTFDWSLYLRVSTRSATFMLDTVKPGSSYSTSPSSAPKEILDAKLGCLKELWSSCLASDPESRPGLLRMISYQACVHLKCRLSLEKTGELLFATLASMMELDEGESKDNEKRGEDDDAEEEEDLYGNSNLMPPSLAVKEVQSASHDDVAVLVKNSPYLLEALLDCLSDAEWSSPVFQTLLVCLMSLLKLMDAGHYEDLWASFWPQIQNGYDLFRDHSLRDEPEDRSPLKELLLKIILVLKEIVQKEVFPRDWLVMSMAKNEIVLAVTKQIAAPLQKFFLQSSSFSGQLWINYFNLCVTFITQPELQVEQFSAVRRTKVLRSGDMRLAMGAHVMCMWAVLGNEDRLGIIPALVGPFLDMTLVAQPLLRKRTIPIFFQIMETELFSKGNFKQVESELIDKLDIFISDGKGDENYVQMFQEILSEKVGESLWVGYGEWNGCALGFIKSVTDLLERLLDYRRVNRGREKHTEKSKMCIVNLLGFYKDIKREELYLRYVYKLHRLHLEGKLYTEAAYALKLHADLLAWSPRMLHSDDLYSAQAEWKRKETLYLLMITYFDLGGCWEKCIPLCKELAVLYESRVFDFTKLSEIHTRLAQFYDSILTKLRLGAEYFRVGFYGSGCPIFLRNKEFVMKGSECERVGDFTSRLQLEFPEARLMVRNTPPDESARSADGQFIQVCCVRPVARDKRADKSVPEDLVDPAKISDKILSFYEYNDVSTFRYDRPIVAPGSETCDNEFKNRWIERTTLKTEHSLPGILTGFVVVDRKTEMITPIDYASETLATTNKELKSLMAAYEEDPKKNLNPLTMRLTGIIDAAVMGGLPKYQEAFLSGEQSEYSAESVSRLKAFIQDQLNATAVALSLHAKLVPAEMIPLQERLVKAFGELEKKMNFRSQADAGRLVKQKSMTERIGMKPVGARRARSEAGELGRKPSIVNTPLPPIPLAESISLLCTGQLRMSSKVDEEEEDKIYCKPSEWRDEDEGFDAAMEYAEPLANEQYYTGVEEFSNSHMRWSGRSTGSTGSFSIPKESTRFSHPEIRATRLQFDDSKQRSVSGNNVSNVYKFVSDPPKSSTSPGPPVPPRAKIPQAPDAPPLPPRAPTIYSKSPQGAPPPQDLPPPLPRRGVSQGSPSMSFCADDEAPPLPPKVQPLSTANLLNVSTSSVESGDISPLRPNYCVPPPMQKANGNANILE